MFYRVETLIGRCLGGSCENYVEYEGENTEEAQNAYFKALEDLTPEMTLNFYAKEDRLDLWELCPPTMPQEKQ